MQNMIRQALASDFRSEWRQMVGRVLLASLLLTLSWGLDAAEVWHTSTIKKIYPQANGTFVIAFNVSAPACTNTAGDKYHYVSPTYNGMTEEGARKMYAAALLALALGQTVQAAFDDSTPACYINRLSIGG